MTKKRPRTVHVDGQQLVAIRKAAGLTQNQLADATGIPQPNLSDFETGKARPTVPTLCRIADACGVDFGYDGKRVTFARRM